MASTFSVTLLSQFLIIVLVASSEILLPTRADDRDVLANYFYQPRPLQREHVSELCQGCAVGQIACQFFFDIRYCAPNEAACFGTPIYCPGYQSPWTGHRGSCSALYETCNDHDDCCDSSTFKCHRREKKCCKRVKAACFSNEQCCSSSCVNRECCKPFGSVCRSDGQCCSGACRNNVCARFSSPVRGGGGYPSSCAAVGNPCHSDSQCCGSNSRCNGSSHCCSKTQGSCSRSSDCCGRSSNCVGGSCCLGTGAKCRRSSQCCSGDCHMYSGERDGHCDARGRYLQSADRDKAEDKNMDLGDDNENLI